MVFSTFSESPSPSPSVYSDLLTPHGSCDGGVPDPAASSTNEQCQSGSAAFPGGLPNGPGLDSSWFQPGNNNGPGMTNSDSWNGLPNGFDGSFYQDQTNMPNMSAGVQPPMSSCVQARVFATVDAIVTVSLPSKPSFPNFNTWNTTSEAASGQNMGSSHPGAGAFYGRGDPELPSFLAPVTSEQTMPTTYLNSGTGLANVQGEADSTWFNRSYGIKGVTENVDHQTHTANGVSNNAPVVPPTETTAEPLYGAFDTAPTPGFIPNDDISFNLSQFIDKKRRCTLHHINNEACQFDYRGNEERSRIAAHVLYEHVDSELLAIRKGQMTIRDAKLLSSLERVNAAQRYEWVCPLVDDNPSMQREVIVNHIKKSHPNFQGLTPQGKGQVPVDAVDTLQHILI